MARAPTAPCWRTPMRSERETFLTHVGRAPRAADRVALGVPDASAGAAIIPAQPGAMRYRQIEYYRMPVMAYLAIDEPRALSRNDFVRLGLVTGAGDDDLPYVGALRRRLRTALLLRPLLGRRRRRRDGRNTRYLCCGHALVVVGDAHWPSSSPAATAACWRSFATSISCCS